jgi:hypothetical protein
MSPEHTKSKDENGSTGVEPVRHSRDGTSRTKEAASMIQVGATSKLCVLEPAIRWYVYITSRNTIEAIVHEDN